MHPTLKIIKTAFTVEQLEFFDLPQVALAGRSNVGKSSLINCLAGQKKLAKISSTPGKTRSINFYHALPEDFFLVDLPGYGYAQTSKKERAKWGKLIEYYVQKATGLRAVAVLLDARLTPQKLDLELVGYLQSIAMPILPVLTKMDKCKQRELALRQKEWQEILRTTIPLPFSSKTGRGKETLWTHLASITS